MISGPLTAQLPRVSTRTTQRNAINICTYGHTHVVQLVGSVDVSLREQASAVFITLASSNKPIVIDLNELTHIDDTGLAFLIQIAGLAHEQNQMVLIRHAPDDVIDRLQELHAIGQFTALTA